MKLLRVFSRLLAAVALVLMASCFNRVRIKGCHDNLLQPVDPQIVLEQVNITWDHYAPIPGTDWANITLIPERGFRMAVVAVDFPDQPVVITLPKGSDLFGNPRIDPISREEVPGFYADFWIKPSKNNNGQTING
jgi:hypothetical protein